MRNRKLFVLGIALVMATQGRSQKTYKDAIQSMITKLPSSKEDTVKVKLLADIILTHLYYDPPKGLVYRKEAITLAEKLQWKKGMAMVMEATGRLYWGISDAEAAIKDHIHALELYQQLGDLQAVSRVSRFIGQDYMDNGRFAEGKVYLDKSLKTAELIGDKKAMASAYSIIAAFYNAQVNMVEATKANYAYLKLIEEEKDSAHLSNALSTLGESLSASGNNTEALIYLKRAVDLSGKNDSSYLEKYQANLSLGDFYLKTGNWAAAMACYTISLGLVEENDSPIAIGYMHSLIANVYKAMGNYNDAIRELLLAVQFLKSNGDSQRVLDMYVQLGTLYTMLGKYDLAKEAFRNAGDPLKKRRAPLFQTDYYNGLQMLDSATGNWRDAYMHYRQYVVLKDSGFNKETLKTQVTSQMQYEADKKAGIEKAVQEKKDLLVQEEAKRQRNIRNAAFIGLGVVLLFSGLVYNQRNKIAKEKKRSDALVQDKELLLREIHHRVKNNLEIVSSLLALQSAQIDDEGTKAAMLEGQNRVQSIGIVHQKLYQGDNLGSIEMKDYFLNLGENILDSFGAEGRITIECAMEKLEVDIDTAVPLGLIVNELLTNALKYAYPDGQKGRVKINLQKHAPGVLHLEVSDDGVGKSGTTKGTGFGGQLIGLLTQQLNGTMREVIQNGTHIFFEFKMEKAA